MSHIQTLIGAADQIDERHLTTMPSSSATVQVTALGSEEVRLPLFGQGTIRLVLGWSGMSEALRLAALAQGTIRLLLEWPAMSEPDGSPKAGR
jgi:hypothetical protein